MTSSNSLATGRAASTTPASLDWMVATTLPTGRRTRACGRGVLVERGVPATVGNRRCSEMDTTDRPRHRYDEATLHALYEVMERAQAAAAAGETMFEVPTDRRRALGQRPPG